MISIRRVLSRLVGDGATVTTEAPELPPGVPPPHLLQQISGDPSPDAFFATLPYIRAGVTRYLGSAGFEFGQFGTILDLGCGVGRFLFAFRDHLGPDQRLWGCDVNAECAEWCRRNIDFAPVVKNDVEAPLPFPAARFDLVYALSVFTHLRFELQVHLAREVYRVLRPGGVAFLSLHGPYFFPIFLRHAREDDEATATADIATVGDDGLFAYLTFGRAGGEQGQTTVAAAHSPEFARDVFEPLRLVRRAPESVLAAGQDVYVFQKASDRAPLAMPLQSGDAGAYRSDASGAIALRFRANGHRAFKSYVTVEPAGHYAATCDVEVVSPDRALVRTALPLNSFRVFGPTHHAIVRLELPPHAGEIEVRLHGRGQGDAGPVPLTLRWEHPVLM